MRLLGMGTKRHLVHTSSQQRSTPCHQKQGMSSNEPLPNTSNNTSFQDGGYRPYNGSFLSMPSCDLLMPLELLLLPKMNIDEDVQISRDQIGKAWRELWSEFHTLNQHWQQSRTSTFEWWRYPTFELAWSQNHGRGKWWGYKWRHLLFHGKCGHRCVASNLEQQRWVDGFHHPKRQWGSFCW